ncbi:RNA-binding S4 domain-containing protein [Pinirhizobacter soli]|uniref:RNA-binding S4 domain-containing protein n=1 Tax=Pinirhizobacter soli TaxID=2786953 RepID=UPI00202A4ACE|nr:S4 domain-containing protein [Pinirhizobacter soli]
MTSSPAAEDGVVRADVWLWAARMYKTRSIARQAIDGGKVDLNGHAVKPARSVRAGDVFELTRGNERIEVRVLAVSERRGPAPDAALLYVETERSIARRQAEVALRRQHAGAPRPPGRPDKQDRRLLQRLKKSIRD